MTKDAFYKLKYILFQQELIYNRRGRPTNINDDLKLGLYLLFVGSIMKIKQLCIIFGVVPTTGQEIINYMMNLGINKLKNKHEAKISWPDELKKSEWASLVQMREPLVNAVIGFVDGVALPVQCCYSFDDQSKYYNGHSKETTINNALAFNPLGKVFDAAINYPGSWHDRQVCSKLIALTISSIGSYQLCVDQEFPRNGDLFDKFVGLLPKKVRSKLSEIDKESIIRKHEIYVSFRQASEWSMRALQGTFCRLKSRLTSNVLKR